MISALGCSPGLGFIHVGHENSFVYDIADLYKAEVTIPAAIHAVKQANDDLNAAVRTNCRKFFQQARLLKRIPEDIEWILSLSGTEQRGSPPVGLLWDPAGEIPGGVNYQGEM